MDAAQIAYISTMALLIIIGEALWIRRLTKRFYVMSAMLGRANAKVAQHHILVTELRELIEEDEDLDRCLREEVAGKAWARARDVEYEQNKARGVDDIPWIPKEKAT